MLDIHIHTSNQMEPDCTEAFIIYCYTNKMSSLEKCICTKSSPNNFWMSVLQKDFTKSATKGKILLFWHKMAGLCIKTLE